MNIRTLDTAVRERVLSAIGRIVKAEPQTSDAPKIPEISTIDRYQLNVNDDDATRRVSEAMRAGLRDDRVR